MEVVVECTTRQANGCDSGNSVSNAASWARMMNSGSTSRHRSLGASDAWLLRDGESRRSHLPSGCSEPTAGRDRGGARDVSHCTEYDEPERADDDVRS